jgi:type IV pilus assembly protein PilA
MKSARITHAQYRRKTMLKKRNEKGFTLMEMLIVVAIIAILVAVSIPVFTSQLDKAKEATDAANERAAKAIAVTTYLTDDGTLTFTGTPDVAPTGSKVAVYYYDAAKGQLVSSSTGLDYGKADDHTCVKVEITDGGEVYTSWEVES